MALPRLDLRSERVVEIGSHILDLVPRTSRLRRDRDIPVGACEIVALRSSGGHEASESEGETHFWFCVSEGVGWLVVGEEVCWELWMLRVFICHHGRTTGRCSGTGELYEHVSPQKRFA